MGIGLTATANGHVHMDPEQDQARCWLILQYTKIMMASSLINHRRTLTMTKINPIV